MQKQHYWLHGHQCAQLAQHLRIYVQRNIQQGTKGAFMIQYCHLYASSVSCVLVVIILLIYFQFYKNASWKVSYIYVYSE